MKRFFLLTAVVAACALAQSAGPYKILKSAKVGGAGGFDYVNTDDTDRRLYIARSGPMGHVTVYDLDTLMQVGDLPGVSAHGAVISAKTHHGFASSRPVTMFDSKTFATIKTIDLGQTAAPDGMLYDPFNDRAWVLSHIAPHVTVINAADGSIAGTIQDIGGMPEQAATDGKGHVYIDVVDKNNIAVIDAKTLMVTGHYDVSSSGGGCAGLSMDAKNNILFAACRNPQNMVILSATDGKILTTLPIGNGTDGALFNPSTMEAFSSHADGTLTIVKEKSPTSFEVEQNLQTMVSAKTAALDTKTNHVLLIAAEFGPPRADAPPPPPGRAGRGPMIADSFTILEVGK
jgi:DNA-binding beta-propeller fold protein YncE